MTPPRLETLPLRTSEDIVQMRQSTRRWMVEHGFSLVDQTKMVTAASELARNAIDYGGGGIAWLELLVDQGRTGIRAEIQDHGPGIANLAQAMTDGYTSGQGLGLGLPGSKRLVDDFEIWSEPGQGTRVSIVKWR